ncbi:methionine ABC transporter permease [Cohnella sp. AR92]|uniref:methionine ABC transporter permease n=1 Tax=Cohnella sp. AR92 TaxID=648716 RepID=UPI000F8F262F|nr:methionine ABC transporter permease [Cohnella sp. AR92]RUS42430.1 ABC transporter permease [Cohnella sp. AR92]
MRDDLFDLLWEGLRETLFMLVWSSFFAVALGLALGIVLVVTDKGHILQAAAINKAFSLLIGGVRSIPFIILIVLLLPVARMIVGTSLGPTAAIVALSIGATPFLGRIVESSLKEVSGGKIEAAIAVGASPLAIIFRVLIPEALPALVRGVTIAIISITELTAVAGAIGAGGLGSLAIRFGYQRFREDIMFATVLVIILLVQTIQWTGDFIAKTIHNRRFKLE